MFRNFFVNNVQSSFSADDDAVYAAFLNGCSDFHIYLYLKVILPFVKSYGDISSFTLSPGSNLM